MIPESTNKKMKYSDEYIRIMSRVKRGTLHYSDAGFVALFLAVLILAIIFALGTSVTILTLGQQRIANDITRSSQAYFAAEAGIEDVLLRLAKNKNWQSSYNFLTGQGSVTIEISEILGGSRTITSTGDVFDRIRKVQVVYQISAEKISFFYGAQVGDGGMEMGNNSRIQGNVFSNGSVVPAKGGDKGYIDDSIIVARNGNRIEGLIIGEDAWVHTCKDSMIEDTLTYVLGGSIENCTAGEPVQKQPNEIESQDLPISQEQIDDWKNDAQLGGVIDGDYTILGGTIESLGPKKINGNLLVDNNSTLNITGTIWVVGNLRIDNGSTIQLDSNFYGSNSGLIVIDGKVKIRPNTYLQGTGQEGSYLMILSTNSEVLDETNPAIDVDNTTDAAIFYASQGIVAIKNNVQAREITAYKIFLDNNAEILYESGLENAHFSSGPGGSWEVASWQETE